ncbi:MAG: hypothetical protein JSV19_09785 [Phycisphaerales bacterium]|nr:MAG: hypothetical protein JSV19_09785 [Phycisphaerales bacterium]
MFDRPEKRLTEYEQWQLVERWKRLCSEFADLAEGQGSPADAQSARRKAELLREMDDVASQLHRDWIAKRAER